MRGTIGTSAALLAVVGVVAAYGPDDQEQGRRAADLTALHEGVAGAAEQVVLAEAEGPGVLVVDLLDGAGDAELAQVEARLGADLDWFHPLARDEALAVGEVEDLGAALEALRGAPLVEVAEAQVQVVAFGSRGDRSWPNDPMYERQWNLPSVGAASGWWSTPRGEGIVVAVIDTGVRAVEDLDASRILPGASFVRGAPTAVDDNGHGTHVAGTIAQSTHNGLGVAGIAPRARILPIKVLSGLGFGTSAGVAAGIDHAVDEGAQVINLSLGGPVYSAVIHRAVRKARAAGVLVIAAAGNDGRTRVSWPGALKEAIGVSAFGPDRTLAPYSNRGKGVDVSAPGGDKRTEGGGILQDTIEGAEGHAYREFQGTSMATPHVAGAAAVLLSTGFLGPDDVERLLLAGADGSSWEPSYGWGRLDLDGALHLIGSGAEAERWAVGGVFALLLAGLSGAGLRFRAAAAVLGAVVAAGVPGVAVLGGVSGALLSRGLLSWPVVLLGPTWGQLPVWLSALVPLTVAFVLGPVRLGRPVAIGVCAGVAGHLVVGLVHGTFQPWWMPAGVASTWLGTHALLCVLAGMAVAGVEALERSRRS